jgi:hypothetical protein
MEGQYKIILYCTLYIYIYIYIYSPLIVPSPYKADLARAHVSCTDVCTRDNEVYHISRLVHSIVAGSRSPVRMATESFSSTLPISVTHYLLRNTALTPSSWFPSISGGTLWDHLTLPRFFFLEPRIIAVLHYEYRKLPPGYTVSL